MTEKSQELIKGLMHASESILVKPQTEPKTIANYLLLLYTTADEIGQEQFFGGEDANQGGRENIITVASVIRNGQSFDVLPKWRNCKLEIKS